MLHKLGLDLEANRVTTIPWLHVKRFAPTSSPSIRVYETRDVALTITSNSPYSSFHRSLHRRPTDSNDPPQKNGRKILAAKSRTAETAKGPFRFLDLPRELRDKVYQNLLCSFAPPRDAATNRQSCPQYTSTVHPAILRCNKQIHREAYDIMVKTNRFIHVKLHGDIHNVQVLLEAMERGTRRIISRNNWAIEHFPGFVLEVDIVLEGKGWPRPEENHAIESHAMILSEEVSNLLGTLELIHRPRKQLTLAISLTVAPGMDTKLASYKESLQPFFSSERIQESLLRPFRNMLHGVQSIKVAGTGKQLAKAVEADIAQHKCTDHKQFLASLKAAGKQGIELFERNDLGAAIEVWEHMIHAITLIHNSSSWPVLCASGGIPFAASIADSLFSTCMNIVHVQVLRHENTSPEFMPKQRANHLYKIGLEQKERIQNSERENYWMDGYTWVRNERQAGRLVFRLAQITKAAAQLEGDFKGLATARTNMESAAELLPDDTTIERAIRALDECMQEMANNMPEDEKRKFQAAVVRVADELLKAQSEGHEYIWFNGY